MHPNRTIKIGDAWMVKLLIRLTIVSMFVGALSVETYAKIRKGESHAEGVVPEFAARSTCTAMMRASV
jgi:hypothetical protein